MLSSNPREVEVSTMNICPKCLCKNPACANWCENCGEMLLPDAQPKPEKPRAFFKEYWYEPTSAKAKFIRFVAAVALLAGLYWSYTVAKAVLFTENTLAFDGVFDQLIAMLPDIGLVCACVFATIAVYIALRSFAEIVQNSTVNRSMNEFMMRKLERLEENR